ncbi:hypothetical protein INR49_027367 [Caranx melampygus]|nr:hypothetical protein INR49_027367 [Caranx melampygus]
MFRGTGLSVVLLLRSYYKTEEVSVEHSCLADLSSSSSLMFVRMLHYCHPQCCFGAAWCESVRQPRPLI